jgi:8-oxo-dGTP pyrophosphatase MutT (NUDIX family)
MKSTKKWSLFEQWKKFLASFFWLDPCAGGICTRERKWKIEILCVTHKDGGLMLPKWRMKPWETMEQTALREFREETGIYNCTLWKKIGTIRDRNRRKKIIFYAIQSSWPHSPVHDEAIMWVHLEDAAKKMKHTTERAFIERYVPRG